MKTYTPYTYLLKCPNGRFYYGVRYAKNCHPSDFWHTYFTSSKEIKKLINQYGKNSFKFEIRKTFDCKKKAINWEHKVLRRLRVDIHTLFENRSIIAAHGKYKRKKSHNKNISKALKGKNKSTQHKKNLSAVKRDEKYRAIAKDNLKKAIQSNTGKKRKTHSEFMVLENKKRAREKDTRIFTWINLTNNYILIGTRYDLREYDHSVKVSELECVIKGKYKSHKGWTTGT